MSKISPAKPEEVVRMLNKLGFQKIRQSGSHAVFRHSNGRWATVPLHKGKDIARGDALQNFERCWYIIRKV